MEVQLKKIELEQQQFFKDIEIIKEGFITNAKESTIAHYFDKMAMSIQRDLGIKPENRADKIQEESML